jgi:hypothetical protein
MTALAPEASDSQPTIGWETITTTQHYAKEHPRIQAVAALVDRLLAYRAELDAEADNYVAVNSPARYAIYAEIYHIDALLYSAPATITSIRGELLDAERRQAIEDQRAHARYQNDLRHA